MKITSDIHIHTNISSCALNDATVERYIERAKKTDLKVIGFSNHLWDSAISGASEWYKPQNVEHVLRLKEQLPPSEEVDGIKILFGCETEFTYEGKLCLAEENFELFDYVLLPHSHTHMKVIVPREWIADEKGHAKYLMDSFMMAVTHPQSKRILSIAHPFVPGTKYELYNRVQSLIPNSYLFEAFSAAKENGIAIEMNGSCLIYMPNTEIPTCEYVRIYSIAKACGCKFTYGSDFHDANSERKLSVVEKFLNQCGIRDCDMLTVDEILARNKS